MSPKKVGLRAKSPSPKAKKASRPTFLGFTQFNKRRSTKKAREYYEETGHTIADLIDINLRLQKAAAICSQQLEVRGIQSKTLLRDPRWIEYFEEAVYHLENFYFRASAFRDKISQFVNQALELGYDEKETGLIKKMSRHRIYKDAHMHTEFKKFEENEDLRTILKRRVYLSHLRYYHNPEVGYGRFLTPQIPAPREVSKRMRMWKSNVRKEIDRVSSFVLVSVKMRNNVVTKINKYKEKTKK